MTELEIEESLFNIFKFIGDDPDREGLQKTPQRVIKAWKELFAGYSQTAEEVLNTSFSEYGTYDSIVLLKDIDFMSFCEHHFLPFSGVAHVAYLPDSKVVGLSKLARLVEMHSKRLQIQEKMTSDIAKDLFAVTECLGVGVVVEAHHSCMGCRGVKKPNALMVTSSVLGKFKTVPEVRSEWFSLLNRK